MAKRRSVPPWVKSWLERVPYIVVLFALLLPFATIRSCGTGEVNSYRGFEIVREASSGFIVLLSAVIAILLFTFSFRRKRAPIFSGFKACIRGALASFTGFLVLMVPVCSFLFDSFAPEPGFFLITGSWGVIYIFCLIEGIRTYLLLKRWKGLALFEAWRSPLCFVNYIITSGFVIFFILLGISEGRKASASLEAFLYLFVPGFLFVLPLFASGVFINFLLKVSPRWGAAALTANGLILVTLLVSGITEIFYLPLAVLVLSFVVF